MRPIFGNGLTTFRSTGRCSSPKTCSEGNSESRTIALSGSTPKQENPQNSPQTSTPGPVESFRITRSRRAFHLRTHGRSNRVRYRAASASSRSRHSCVAVPSRLRISTRSIPFKVCCCARIWLDKSVTCRMALRSNTVLLTIETACALRAHSTGAAIWQSHLLAFGQGSLDTRQRVFSRDGLGSPRIIGDARLVSPCLRTWPLGGETVRR